MKIAVLWTALSGYLNACLKELASRDDVELFVAHQGSSDEAPFAAGQFAWITNRVTWAHELKAEQLEGRLQSFAPDLLVFSGWHVRAYREIAQSLAGRCFRIMAMDNCWLGTARQRCGVITSSWFLKPIADAVWLPGERQAVFAEKLGFAQHQIFRGLYSCDSASFKQQHLSRTRESRSLPHSFLFVGRLIPQKGLETLIDAYAIYRQGTVNPWPLVCCGAGPLLSRIEAQPGVRSQGFVQPEQLPHVMADAGCLLVPSTCEPWGVVVHEAVSAGLLVIASQGVGSAVHLVQPNYNGFFCDIGDARHLARLLSHVTAMDNSQLNEMSQASYALSCQYSPTLWANTILQSMQST